MIPLRDNAPSYDVPWVNLGLIGACALVFAWQLNYPGGLEASRAAWGEVPTRILGGENVPGTNVSAWWTMFTSMWMHGNWEHIIGNMWMLWLLGDNIEWLLGRWRYLLFYVACGLLASVATVLLGFQSDLPGLGASGAIAGVMAAYLLIYPRARITCLMWVRPWSFDHVIIGDWGLLVRNFSAFWFIGLWLVFQVLLATMFIAGGTWINLGIYAHVAGAVAGGVLVWPLMIKDRRPARTHHTRKADLTGAIYGSEGDAGGASEPVLSLGEEVSRLRERESRRKSRYRIPEQPFADHIAADLLAQGDLDGAFAHCQDMLDIARRQQNETRIRGYRRLLKEITALRREKMQGPLTQRRVETTQVKLAENGRAVLPYEQRLEEVKRRLRGDADRGDRLDWL